MAEDIRSSSPGEYGQTRLVAATIGFAASPVTLEALAIGDVVVSVWVEVLTAFNAATTNVLTVGDGTTANKYLAAADVDETTPGASASKGPFAAETAARTLKVTYAQTGAAATAGSARVYALVTSSAV